MPLECDVIVDRDVAFALSDRLADLLRHAARAEPSLAAADWQMTIRLCSDRTISALHDRFFSDPAPTDVISFPSGESPVGGGYLGDVVVSIDTAAAQASDGGHFRDREVAFLALHGMLHLCGYDDSNPDERSAMHQRQSELLADWERDEGCPW